MGLLHVNKHRWSPRAVTMSRSCNIRRRRSPSISRPSPISGKSGKGRPQRKQWNTSWKPNGTPLKSIARMRATGYRKSNEAMAALLENRRNKANAEVRKQTQEGPWSEYEFAFHAGAGAATPNRSHSLPFPLSNTNKKRWLKKKKENCFVRTLHPISSVTSTPLHPINGDLQSHYGILVLVLSLIEDPLNFLEEKEKFQRPTMAFSLLTF